MASKPMVAIENLAEYLSRVHGHDERISARDLLFGHGALSGSQEFLRVNI